jgi:1-aminocyclopropane-1-carboxylate deaminase/D-cysteine desulfhydrase-like pyridoxal-dependent ACC family enzyme
MPAFPRFALFDQPSPLHPLPRFSAALGGRVEVWVKREDLLPLAFGGNKLRNLEFLVGAALADGADTLVTSGRRWSNHCRLTAAAGARAGLTVHLVLSGPPAQRPGPGIVLAETLGAQVRQLPTADRAARDAEVDRVVAEVRDRGGRPYVIAVGGSGVVGAWGQLLAAREALDQAADAGLAIDRFVLPSATGGTQAGLIVGSAAGRAAGSGTGGRRSAVLVTGFAVARAVDELRPAIAAMIDGLAAEAGLEPPPLDAIELDDAQLGEGYGRPTAAAAEAAGLLARSEGLLVDPIYTAKALAGLVAAARDGRWDGQRVVFWHAGGLPGLFEPLD